MPGTYATDALETNLLTGATLNSAGTTSSTAVEVDWTGVAEFVLTAATATGTTPTLDVVIQGSETSGFGSSVNLGAFSQQTATGTKYLVADVRSKYIRASVKLGGTTPSFASSTLYLRPTRYNWSKTNTA